MCFSFFRFFALAGHMATLQKANKIVWPARSYSPTATATRSPSWSPSPRLPHISSGIPTLIKSSNEQFLKTREKNILARISKDVSRRKNEITSRAFTNAKKESKIYKTRCKRNDLIQMQHAKAN